MASKSRVLISLFLVLTICGAGLVQPGLAQVQPPPQFPTIPGLLPPGLPVDLTKCWSSLFNVQGCVFEIYRSILTGQFGNVGATCCKEFLAIDANCWPRMFPLNPFFPPLLKDNCSRIVAAPPASK